MSHWKQARWPFVVFVLIEVVIFGSGSAVTKFAYDSITPLWCLAVRFGLPRRWSRSSSGAASSRGFAA